jgi:hypothetical protein
MSGNGRWRARELRRLGYSQGSVPVIMLYNEICVPNGFWPVNAFSEPLEAALVDVFVPEDGLGEYEAMFREAVSEYAAGGSSYNTPRGAKLIRILWNNY